MPKTFRKTEKQPFREIVIRLRWKKIDRTRAYRGQHAAGGMHLLCLLLALVLACENRQTSSSKKKQLNALALSAAVQDVLYLKAMVRPVEIKTLTAPISGLLQSSLRKGSSLAKGSALLEIINADFKREKADLERRIQSKKLELALSKNRLTREKELLKKRATSLEEYEMRETAFQLNQNELQLIEAQLRFISNKLKATKRIAERPIIILELFKGNGEKVEEGERIASYYEADELNVVFLAPKHLYGSLKIGDALTLRNLQANVSMPGSVSRIAPFLEGNGFEVAARLESPALGSLANGQELEAVVKAVSSK